MKKALSLLMIVALVATSIVIPATAATAGTAPTGAYYNAETGEYEADTNVVKEVYADLDLNDAKFDFTNYSVDNGDGTYTVTVNKEWSNVISTTNKATTDKEVRVQLYPSAVYTDAACTELISESPTNITSSFYKIASISNDEPDNKVLIGNGAEQYTYVRFLVDQGSSGAVGVVPTQSNQLVYADMRIRRTNKNKASPKIILKSTDNKDIAVITFDGNGAKLQDKDATVTSDSYPSTEDWKYVRFVMNFYTDKFKVYVGDSLDTLHPFLSSVDSYDMINSVDSFYYIGNDNNKGTLGYDDVSIYMVEEPFKPIISNVTMTGKPNIGETLTCSYEYMCEDGVIEGASYSYWEASDTSSFSEATKISENILVKADQPSEYIIKESDTGKYIRCVVVPMNENGIKGETGISNTNDFPVNYISYSIYIDGQKKGTNFEFKDREEALRLYKGGLTVRSTSNLVENSYLIAAWYETTVDEETGTVYPELKNVKIAPIATVDATATESGYIETTFTTDVVYRVTNASEEQKLTSQLRMKVMLVEDLKELKPLLPYVTIGASPEF